jgi:hypothetical protein
VLVPIRGNFSDLSSLSRLESMERIKLQQKYGKDGAKSRMQEVRQNVAAKLGQKRLDEIIREEPRCTQYSQLDLKNGFANYLSISWGYSVANCAFYSRMVTVAFAFNHMNTVVFNRKNPQGKKPWRFKEAAIVRTVPTNPPTQGHTFVLVEANNGDMFAVDAWNGEKVIKLEGATKLSDIPPTQQPKTYPNPEVLNDLFAYTDDKGIKYYDEETVGKTTQWYLLRDASKAIEDFVYTYDADNRDLSVRAKDKNNLVHMKDIYNYLHDKFPGWSAGYEELFGR